MCAAYRKLPGMTTIMTIAITTKGVNKNTFLGVTFLLWVECLDVLITTELLNLDG